MNLLYIFIISKILVHIFFPDKPLKFNRKRLLHKLFYISVIFYNIFRWTFSGKTYFKDILWEPAYNNNTLPDAGISSNKILKYKEHSYGKEKGKGVIFLTGYIQCKQSLSPRSLELKGNFQTQRWSNIWEDTENKLSPIPQVYTLNSLLWISGI